MGAGHWARRGAQAGAGAQARAHGTGAGRAAWARPGRGLGVLLGQQAVHSMHSACFDPVSTQYCS